MTNLAEAFADAQETAVRGSAGLRTAMGLTAVRFYDGDVPNNAALPYVVGGDDLVTETPNACGAEGEIFSTVEWWSKPEPNSNRQARAMGTALKAVLAANLTVTGHTVDEFEIQSEIYRTDPDGSTKGQLIIRYLTTST